MFNTVIFCAVFCSSSAESELLRDLRLVPCPIGMTKLASKHGPASGEACWAYAELHVSYF